MQEYYVKFNKDGAIINYTWNALLDAFRKQIIDNNDICLSVEESDENIAKIKQIIEEEIWSSPRGNEPVRQMMTEEKLFDEGYRLCECCDEWKLNHLFNNESVQGSTLICDNCWNEE